MTRVTERHTATQTIDYFIVCCSSGCSFLVVADKESQVFKKGFNVSLHSGLKLLCFAFMVMSSVRTVANLPINKNGFQMYIKVNMSCTIRRFHWG